MGIKKAFLSTEQNRGPQTESGVKVAVNWDRKRITRHCPSPLTEMERMLCCKGGPQAVAGSAAPVIGHRQKSQLFAHPVRVGADNVKYRFGSRCFKGTEVTKPAARS